MKKLIILKILLLISIINFAQYQVPEYVQNYDSDKPTVYAVDLGGGYHQVTDSTAKANLSSDKRVVGMMVSFKENGKWVTDRYEGVNTLTVNWINYDNWERITINDTLQYYSLTTDMRLEIQDSIDNISTAKIEVDTLRSLNDSIYIKSDLSGLDAVFDTLKANIYIGAAMVAGDDYEIQYNYGGLLESSDNFKYKDDTLRLYKNISSTTDTTKINGVFQVGENYEWNGKTLNILFGIDNVLIGTGAGTSMLTGNSNTFLGKNAGNSETTGIRNVYIGEAAGEDAANKDNNTYVGYSAGANNNGGDFNTFLGANAGLNSSGGYNIFVGNSAGSNATGSNKLYIENSNSATPLIYGEFDNDYLKINADSAEVTGNFTSDPMLSCYAFRDSSVLINLTQNVWQRITNSTHTLFISQVAEDFTNAGDTIVANDHCRYASIFYTVSATFADADTHKLSVLINGGPTRVDGSTFVGKGTTTTITGKCIQPVNTGDYFELQIINTTDNDDVTVICGGMMIVKEF